MSKGDLLSGAAQPAPKAEVPNALHQVFWQVLKPNTIVNPQTGQPGYEIVQTTEFQYQAAAFCRNIPGAAVMMCCIVHVNPAVIPGMIRTQ